jgi:hypothetical protein
MKGTAEPWPTHWRDVLDHRTLAITWPQGVHNQGSNPTEAAQVHGTVRCSWGLETFALEEVRLDTSDRAETRNSS